VIFGRNDNTKGCLQPEYHSCGQTLFLRTSSYSGALKVATCMTQLDVVLGAVAL
jgi:hypothetical protein